MKYNTARGPVFLKEYGRNIQKIVDYIKKEPDKTERTRLTIILINLMKQLKPNMNQQEDIQKFWDHLLLIAQYNLDIDFPEEIIVTTSKPTTEFQRMHHKSNRISFKQYGMNMEMVIKEALKIEDAAERKDTFIRIGRLMKYFYSTWNKDVQVDDKLISKHISRITGGKMNFSDDVKEISKLFDGYSHAKEKIKDKKKKRQNHSN